MHFDKMFEYITGNKPYPWQQRLYKMFLDGKIPDMLDIPTGLGKTSIIFVWLLAWYKTQVISTKTRIPSRLIYIVDRRVIVDQATDEIQKLQDKVKNLMNDKLNHINISTFRGGGGLADNKSWLKYPHEPAIIIGTVDMVGSRLFFSGYGVGHKTKSFYAGLLGQDSLIVLDETHLSPALEKSLVDSKIISQNVKERLFPLNICLMSATQHRDSDNKFGLDKNDLTNQEIKKRYNAKKYLRILDIKQNKIPEVISQHALKKKGRVLIYLQKPNDVKKTKEIIEKHGKPSVALTGTLRGWERDALVENKTYQSFLASNKINPKHDSCFLISTSAGEVGIDIDADHMLCDLTTFDSLVQRLGRVNRTGNTSNAEVTVMYSDEIIQKNKLMSSQLEKTKNILKQLTKNGMYNASPYNLSKISLDEKQEAMASKPKCQPLTKDILDMWAMTSIYEKYSSRPDVSYWLRGEPEYSIPDTYVVWREDVKYLINVNEEKIEDILDTYRVLPHEIARDYSYNVHLFLQKLQTKDSKLQIIIQTQDGKCYVKNINDIDQKDLYFATVFLSPDAGGLDSNGFLSNTESNASDVADKEPPSNLKDIDSKHIDSAENLKRARLVIKHGDDGSPIITKHLGFKAVAEFDKWVATNKHLILSNTVEICNNEDDRIIEEIYYYVKKSERQQNISTKPQKLEDHLNDVENVAKKMIQNMVLPKNIRDAVVIAAKYHDIGKQHDHWQTCMRVNPQDRPLAKTGSNQRPLNMGGFRHEFASIIKGMKENTISAHPEKDLILHLISSHHGWARPCFKPNAFFDADESTNVDVLTRYTMLQRRFGCWGLAWLEGIVRGADWQASETRDSRQ